MLQLLATLLLGHLVADFPLQTNTIAKLKHEGHLGLLVHVFIYMGATAILLQEPLRHIGLIIFLGVCHWIIDSIKVNVGGCDARRGFIIDQISHLTSMGAAALIVTHVATEVPPVRLPAPVLYPALLYAILLSIMVFAWIWANTLHEDVVSQHPVVCWMRKQMLTLSQRAGLVLVGGVAIKLFF